jgi:flagellar basal-body rod protein FlgB
MTLFTDSVQGALERALDGVSLRQRVTAQNIANVMTPGYQAQRVSFEDSLGAALGQGADPMTTELSVNATGDPSNASGNNVDLATESASLMRSDLQYQALVQAASFRYTVLHDAVR